MASDQSKTSYVKFPTIIEQRIVYVLLKNACMLIIKTILLYQRLDLTQIRLHLYSSTSICIFTRFQDPDILLWSIWLALIFLIILFKIWKICVIYPSLYMESQRQSIKHQVLGICAFRCLIGTTIIVIIPHIEKQSFFIIEMLIEFKTIINFLELSLAFFNHIF